MVPEQLELAAYQPSTEQPGASPRLETDGQTRYLVWSLEGELEPGARYEYQSEVKVEPVMRHTILEGKASVSDSANRVLAEESVSVAIWAKGRYLRYLPELYEQDELMGRLVMLFESFWAPIETQVGAMSHYLEPRTTPKAFMPWLASWLGLELDERLIEERQRELIRAAIRLHRRRGTKSALQEYLEIYTAGRVQIVEHRAVDFCLGAEGKLGLGVALGTGNHPHTFTVTLTLPADSSSEEAGDEVRVRRAVAAIIDAEKPAHTDYTLIVEHVSSQ
jgi:phage tail-like protein